MISGRMGAGQIEVAANLIEIAQAVRSQPDLAGRLQLVITANKSSWSAGEAHLPNRDQTPTGQSSDAGQNSILGELFEYAIQQRNSYAVVHNETYAGAITIAIF